ncbi:DUF262 domain-containing protein [Streptomyces cyaneofuscatus]|uniref:DUF262 domain-containing protein n=1 Tax=Streptomyces cyaneofuscatus TaxID=66883 RepID=UPI0036DD1B61
MATDSILEQFRVHDFLSWHEAGSLILNPDFQRREVWRPEAKIYLIDSILRRMPIPKVYIRTVVDPRTRKSKREVVDGQQRLRAIIQFAEDGFTLTRRTGEFSGLQYSTMPEELQQEFLTYPIAVDTLQTASDSDVLEVFARLNSYTVSLNSAEKRHAKYQTAFKWAVHEAARDWKALWEDLNIISGRDRLRMGDDSLMAEMFSVVMKGVTDGGSVAIDRLYAENDDDFQQEDAVRSILDQALNSIVTNHGSLIASTQLKRSPQFLMLFAAFCHGLQGLKQGDVPFDLPPGGRGLRASAQVESSLTSLAAALAEGATTGDYAAFVHASGVSTQRISTRSVRLEHYINAVCQP